MIIRIFQNHPFISCLGKTFVRWKLVFSLLLIYCVWWDQDFSLYLKKKKKKLEFAMHSNDWIDPGTW